MAKYTESCGEVTARHRGPCKEQRPGDGVRRTRVGRRFCLISLSRQKPL